MEGFTFRSRIARPENFLDEEAFERSLILNLLFEHGIQISDILCVISAGLERRLSHSDVTLFEVAVEDGLIIPPALDWNRRRRCW